MSKSYFRRAPVYLKEELSTEISTETPKFRIREWFPDLPEKILGAIEVYHEEMLKFNSSVNLISSGTVHEADRIHFADAIQACRLIQSSIDVSGTVYDFGSGNGLPGLIFGILFPDYHVVLVDRDSRKMEFCKHVISLLKIENVTVLNDSIQSLADESVDIAICRGLASLSKTMLLTRQLLRPKGQLFHLKGESWARELAETPTQIFSSWTVKPVGNYKIPVKGEELSVVLSRRVK